MSKSIERYCSFIYDEKHLYIEKQSLYLKMVVSHLDERMSTTISAPLTNAHM